MDQEQLQEYAKQYGQVVAKVWADDNFKARFIADPAAVFAEQGIPIPAGVELRVVENTANVVHLALPPKPSDDLSDEQLNQVAGGTTAGSAGCLSSVSCICSSLGSVMSVGTISTAS